MPSSELEMIIVRLEKLIDKTWKKQCEAAKMEEKQKEARKVERMEKDREAYVSFCERLIKAGAVAGKIPTFQQWRNG